MAWLLLTIDNMVMHASNYVAYSIRIMVVKGQSRVEHTSPPVGRVGNNEFCDQ